MSVSDGIVKLSSCIFLYESDRNSEDDGSHVGKTDKRRDFLLMLRCSKRA